MFSIGVSKITIDDTDIGSCLNATIEYEPTLIPIHDKPVGDAMLVGNKFYAKSMQGSLTFTIEEIGLFQHMFTAMAGVIKGTAPAKVKFKCGIPFTSGSIGGSIMLLPQFTTNGQIEQFTTATFKFPICDITSPSTSGSVDSTTVAGVKFLTPTSSGNNVSFTNSTKNLCLGATYNGLLAAGVAVSCSCQTRPIFRKQLDETKVPWPSDYVIDAVSINAILDFADFKSAGDTFSIDKEVSIDFVSLGGATASLSLGKHCVVSPVGLVSNGSSYNTWRLRIDGNGL